MGPANNSLPETVICMLPDGSCYTFCPGDLKDYDPTEYGYARDDPGPPGDPGLPVDQHFVIETTIAKYFRCRSRKRLIKLLMANKLSRDKAGRIAQQVCESGLSYQAAWQQIWPQLFWM